NRGANEDGLIGQRSNDELWWQRTVNLLQRRFYLGDDVEGRGATSFQNRKQSRALTVDTNDVSLRRRAVTNVSHVTYINDRAIHGAYRKIVELLHGPRTAVEIDVIFKRTDLGGAGRQDQVLCADGIYYVNRRQAL